MRATLHRFGWPAAYVAVALAFVAMVARFYHPVYGFTAFFQLDAAEERVMLPALRERPVFVYRSGPYDGMFYAQLALSPTLRDPALPKAMDDFGYRARRMLCSWIAWLAGGGDSARVLDAYALLNPVCWFILALLLLRWFPPRSVHDTIAWAGLLLSAGLLSSVRLALTDLPALLLVVGAIFAMERGRAGGATACLAAAALARETSLAAAFALAERRLGRFALRGLLALLPVLLWWLYVRSVAGSASPGLGNFGWPGLEFFRKWRDCLAGFPNPTYPLVPWLTLATLVGLTVQVAWVLLRPQWGQPVWRAALGYAVLALTLGMSPWLGYPGAAARILLVLHFAFNRLAPRTRWGLGLLVAGNLSFACGLDQMLNTAVYDQDLAGARRGGAIYLLVPGDGCYEIEHRGPRRWCWAADHAEFRLAGWRQTGTARVRLQFAVTGFFPQQLTIRRGGTVLWSGAIGRKAVPVDLVLDVPPAGGARLEFSSDQPPRLENASATARPLAFSVSDGVISP